MKKLFVLLMSIMGLLEVPAQNAYCEYWIDDNRQAGGRRVVTETEQSFTFDISNMSYGLHFLNCRVFNTEGEAGTWKQIMFYINNGAFVENNLFCEYWIDDNRPLGARKPFTETGEFLYSFDISNMTYGLHFLNYRVLDSNGGSGTWKQIAFYISNGAFDQSPITYEYWIDNEEHVVGSGMMGASLPLVIDTEGLAFGKHTFHFKACNEAGVWGDEYTVEFLTVLAGDVNNDNLVTIADAVAIVNYILGNPSTGFNINNANVIGDVDKDGNPNITITDAVGIVNIILNQGDASAPQLETKEIK